LFSITIVKTEPVAHGAAESAAVRVNGAQTSDVFPDVFVQAVVRSRAGTKVLMASTSTNQSLQTDVRLHVVDAPEFRHRLSTLFARRLVRIHAHDLP
jgi:hypothetical protein